MTTCDSSFTCASCHALFATAAAQRQHYQSDWHRYNLRRKVQELPPVKEALFEAKVREIEAGGVKEAEKCFECLGCRKRFASQASFQNHLKSRKHREICNDINEDDNTRITPSTKNQQTKHERGEEEEEEGDSSLDNEALIQKKLAASKTRLQEGDCIFCTKSFANISLSLEHMRTQHAFYIPDAAYVSDLTGLIAYLRDKVSVAHLCLWCPVGVQPFSSLEAVRSHMHSKGHNKIRFEEDDGQPELSPFYTHATIVEEGEEDSSEYEDISEGEWEQMNTLMISPEESELLLPNGRRLGNREHRYIYKQNLLGSTQRLSRRSEHAQTAISSKSSDQSLQLANNPALQRQFKLDQRAERRAMKAERLGVGERANKLQTFFRLQLRE